MKIKTNSPDVTVLGEVNEIDTQGEMFDSFPSFVCE